MSAYGPAGSGIVHAASRRKTPAFLGLFIVPSVAQSILLTVVPLEAPRLLATARAVTLLYVAAGSGRRGGTPQHPAAGAVDPAAARAQA